MSVDKEVEDEEEKSLSILSSQKSHGHHHHDQKETEEERIKKIALGKLREKLFYAADLDEQRDSQMDLGNKKIFQKEIPKYLRIKIKEDVITSLLKD